MATVKTNKKASRAYAELAELEAALAKATEQSNVIGQELRSSQEEVDVLLDHRRRLVHSDPELVNHRGEPTKAKGNPVGQVDKKLAEYDLEDLRARYDHARALERKAQQRVYDHLQAHYGDVIDAFRPEAEQAAEDVRVAVAAAYDSVEAWLNTWRRGVGLTHPMADIDGRDVPGTEHASALLKALRGVELPVPSPPRSK